MFIHGAQKQQSQCTTAILKQYYQVSDAVIR